jgi:hypothetical protein
MRTHCLSRDAGRPEAPPCSAAGARSSAASKSTGAAVLAYDGARHHLYVRGVAGTTLAMLAVCPDGGLEVMAEIPISEQGHASTTDGRGQVWLADATTGRLVRIRDPFASTD